MERMEKFNEKIFIFVANKGGCGKTLFSLVSIIQGYLEGKRVAAIDLNFENPDTATILHGIAEGNTVPGSKIINEGTPLAYQEERINDRLYSFLPHPLYHHGYEIFTFLDQFLYRNAGRFDLVVVDTGLNLPNLMPLELTGERWPRGRAIPTIFQLYNFSSGLKPWELEAMNNTVGHMKKFFFEDYDKTNIVHVLNPQAFIPNSLKANLKYLYNAKFAFEGADQMIKRIKKLGKRGVYNPVSWEMFRDEILLEVRKEFWKQPLGEFWKDEIPSIWIDVMNKFLKKHEIVPTNVFFHPYVYHRVQLIVDDLVIRRGKDPGKIHDLIEPVFENFEEFMGYHAMGPAPPTRT